ncbi:hypothetical protein [Flindersiella endophytica]
MAYESGNRGWRPPRHSPRKPCLCSELEPAKGTDLGRVVKEASVGQLRQLWQLAGEELRARHLPATVASIVELRRLTLEELALRDPDGFGRWLANSSRMSEPCTHASIDHCG